MKENGLNRLVREHRESFDHRSPPEKVWRGISSVLFGKETVSLWNSVAVWRAAALVLLGISIYLFVSGKPSVNIAGLTSSQEFSDVESYYSAQISEKVALIKNEDLFADNSFTQDLQKLEAMYAVLADEMKRHPSERVKDALVLNMIVRIDLLNQQIQKLEETRREQARASDI